MKSEWKFDTFVGHDAVMALLDSASSSSLADLCGEQSISLNIATMRRAGGPKSRLSAGLLYALTRALGENLANWPADVPLAPPGTRRGGVNPDVAAARAQLAAARDSAREALTALQSAGIAVPASLYEAAGIAPPVK
ncbi:MAG: hypothetical protein LBU39_05835 [Desulfobulbaceae bacterium]|jgi:hypothetical protein|nr:hypothetical protein [Desulfobulbaceae bacterium]